MEFIGEQTNTETDFRLQEEPFPIRILFALQKNTYASIWCNFEFKITWSRLEGHLQNFMCGVSRMKTISHVKILILIKDVERRRFTCSFVGRIYRMCYSSTDLKYVFLNINMKAERSGSPMPFDTLYMEIFFVVVYSLF